MYGLSVRTWTMLLIVSVCRLSLLALIRNQMVALICLYGNVVFLANQGCVTTQTNRRQENFNNLQTLWEGGIYPLTCTFSEEYPSKPPKCKPPHACKGSSTNAKQVNSLQDFSTLIYIHLEQYV